jgi:hypothetical protein
MGERRARWGYGFQDKLATAQILDALRVDLRQGTSHFQGVRLADLEAGRVDDFVLLFDFSVQGNSIKWSREAEPVNWGDLIGTSGLLRELAAGYQQLTAVHAGKTVTVQLQTSRPAATTIHPSQLIADISVKTFVDQAWSVGPSPTDSEPLTRAWEKIRAHTELSPDDFRTFVSNCRLRFGLQQPPQSGNVTIDDRAYLDQFEDLHKALATWITNNPDHEIIDRSFLLSAIGVAPYRSGLEQRFPAPKIPYERNSIAAGRIRDAIDSHTGGYLAVTGQAGIGKSTLVQDILSECPFFVPYYAYLPDGIGNPRDRGEALTFFQDVVTRLDRFFDARQSLGVKDVSHGRDALRKQMEMAHTLFAQDGRKTILLIDGLDHVQRELGIDRPLLHELPRPDEVPEGFLIILSTQPQALLPTAIERHISARFSAEPYRVVHVEGLSREEVHSIAQQFRPTLRPEDRDSLFTASGGNPLILTYLLRCLDADPHTSIQTVFSPSAAYSGDIDEYYRTALGTALIDIETRSLLGLLCRAIAPVPVGWLQTWPEWPKLEHLYLTTLQPFVVMESGSLSFIHNSFVAFLKSETRSAIPGADLEADERRRYSMLAERSGNAFCDSPIGRAKIFYLFRAGRNEELLSVLSNEWLRHGITAFVPYAEIDPILLHGLSAAWKLHDMGNVLRLILLQFELGARTGRLYAEDLAKRLLDLDRPELAAVQVRSGGRILIDDSRALRASEDLQRYALIHGDAELAKQSRVIYLQSKPISLLYRAEPISAWDISRDSALEQWAGIATLFEGPIEVCSQIVGLRVAEPQHETEPTPEVVKAGLLYSSLIASLRDGAPLADCVPFLITLARLKSQPINFAARLRVCSYFPRPLFARKLRRQHAQIVVPDDLELQYAELMWRSGETVEARSTCSRLRESHVDKYRTERSFGMTDISYLVRLRRLQRVLGIESAASPTVIDEDGEAVARIEVAARQLGDLFAAVELHQNTSGLRPIFRSLLLFYNRPVQVSSIGPHSTYRIGRDRIRIYRYVTELAENIGQVAVEALRDEFLGLMSGPAAAQFTPAHRRLFAKFFFETGSIERHVAKEIALSAISEVESDDPVERQEGCLDLAAFMHSIGEDGAAQEWIDRAGRVSAGAGSHKDYHMTQLAGWLTTASRDRVEARTARILDKFMRCIQVAGGAGASRAASHLLEFLVQARPVGATPVAIELINREILNVDDALEALLLGATKCGTSSSLLLAVYGELLTLLSTGHTTAVASAILRNSPRGLWPDHARELMTFVRTRSLPSYRMGVARGLQDTLLEEGLDAPDLEAGLVADHNDSSMESSLYLLVDGTRLTVAEVAGRLSDVSRQDLWNPNPSANERFGWWRAISRATVASLAHADALLASLTIADYEQVAVLAWKSRICLSAGDRTAAKTFAESAIAAADDRSWFSQMDGAKLRDAYGALMQVDEDFGLERARERFGADLSGGKLWNTMLLDDAPEIIEFLRLDWPSDAVLSAIEDYVDNVLSVNRDVQPFPVFDEPEVHIHSDRALLRFVIFLLAFPVVDVGVAARCAIARFLTKAPDATSSLVADFDKCDCVQLEHLLAAIHVGTKGTTLACIPAIVSLNTNQSAAVRAVARRICELHGWEWREVTNIPPQPLIVLPQTGPEEGQEYVIDDSGLRSTLTQLSGRIALSLARNDRELEELTSEVLQQYWKVEPSYAWSNETRLAAWRDAVKAQFWLSKRATVGREAAMRVLGLRALAGRSPAGTESVYDALYPIYDPALELFPAAERTAELQALRWSVMDEGKKEWLAGQQADAWSNYPTKIGDLSLIGERTYFIRPDWGSPRERRVRGILDTDAVSESSETLATERELTYEGYLRGFGQGDELIVVNSERQLVGPAYRWIAFNARIARSFGWAPAAGAPFEWRSPSGELMVRSIFWRDGWIGLRPPHMESLGEGWFVVATGVALSRVLSSFPGARTHLWVERDSNGDTPIHRQWHLTAPLSSYVQ